MDEYYLRGEERFGTVTAPLYEFFARTPPMRQFYSFILRDLQGSRARSFLDVGAGPALLDALLAKDGSRVVYAVDPSEAMLRFAEKRARGMGNLRVSLGSSRRLKLDRKFEMIFSALSFHHWARQEESLRYLRDFLARDGEIRVYEFERERNGAIFRRVAGSHSTTAEELTRTGRRAGMELAGSIVEGRFLRVAFSPER